MNYQDICARFGLTTLIGADLSDADLRLASLEGADLRGASLNRTDLEGADLRYANLEGANLTIVDLRYANLEGANLKNTILAGADLEEANLTNTKFDYQIESGLIKKIAKEALKHKSLDMAVWHTCDTIHCIAGWATYLAEKGEELEEKHGTEVAGLLLLGADAHSHFFDSTHKAKEYLASFL